MFWAICGDNPIGVTIRPVKGLRKKKGLESWFVPLTYTAAAKLFPHEDEAVRSRDRQIIAHSHRLGPEVLSEVRQFAHYDRDSERLVRMWGYFTQIAKPVGKLTRKAHEAFLDEMERFGFLTGDIGPHNLGRIRRRLVCIDFGDETHSIPR